MAQTTYQVAVNVKDSQHEAGYAMEILSSAIVNAMAFNLTLERLLLDGAGRVRFSLNNPLPAEELASFAGTIVEV